MQLPKIAVKRPISTIMFFLAILLLGLVSLKMLPLDVMPDMELPTLTVITVFPGASAEEVEQQVTKELEGTLSGAENLKKLTSTSKENVSFVSMQYSWGADITEAANNARDLLELSKRHLPNDAHDPIIYKINSSMMPVIVIGISAEENFYGLENIIEDKITTRLRKIEGVGSVLSLGYPEREIKINVDPQKLYAYKISMQMISTILQAENITIPGGSIKVGSSEFTVKVPGEFSNIEEIKEIVLINFNGRIVRVADIAEVQDGFKEKDEFAHTRDSRSAVVMIQKQSGTNTLKVVNALRNELKLIENTLPEDVELNEVIATDELVTESIRNLSSTLWYAFIFVILVVFAFLREWRSSLIISLTIPFSLISAFILMFLAGYSINIFSLMALVIAIGMVVDNAIVVMENITQHIEKGTRPDQAAIYGTSEMGTAIVASTATTLMVFLPMVFMGGIVGVMFKQLAIITTVTLFASLIAAMSLTPMLASRFIRPHSKEKTKHGRLFQVTERLFTSVENRYKKILIWSVTNRKLVYVIVIVIFGVTMWMGTTLGTDYIAEFDAGDVSTVFKLEVGSTAEETDRVAQNVKQIFIEEIPEMNPSSLITVAGQTESGLLSMVGFSEGKNVSTVLCHLSLCNERDRSAKEIADVIRKRMTEIPEIVDYHVTGGSILSAGLLGNLKPIEIEISGDDLVQINAIADTLEKYLQKENGFKDVQTTVDPGKLEIQIIVDKKKASQLALNTAMIGLQIRQSIFGTESGEFTENGEDYDITLRYNPESRNDINKLHNITLTNLTGNQIKLEQVARIVEDSGVLEIEHKAQQRIVYVKSEVEDLSLGDAAQRAEEIISQIDKPENIDIRLGGQVTEQQDSFGDLYLILILGILLVYMIMAAQFESFKDPFIIMFAVPFTFIGIIWAFKLTGLTLSVTTFIGMIMLMGIVVNNGIVLVTYTNLLRARGNTLVKAVTDAGHSRLRPVLMTSLTTILAMVPMALSKGMGKEMYSPLGVTLIGGLLVSTLITLILVPVIYTSLNRKSLVEEEK